MRSELRRFCSIISLLLAILVFSGPALAQVDIPTNNPPMYGPYNASFLPDGAGLKKQLQKADTVLRAESPWTLSGWVWLAEPLSGPSLLMGLGKTTEGFPRYIGVMDGQLLIWGGKENSLASQAGLTPGKWHFVALTQEEGRFQLFSGAEKVASGRLDIGSVPPVLQLAPTSLPWPNGKHFGGKLADVELVRRALSAEELRTLAQKAPDFSAILFEEGSKPWPVQTYGQAGYRAPQDPALLPRSRAPFSKPSATPTKEGAKAISTTDGKDWTLSGGWKLRPAPEVKEPAEAIAQSLFVPKGWWNATVPGTVLTTMVDQGIYADPDYGLNNLTIPESLNKQDYWYRTEFTAPSEWKGRHLTLTFHGINYLATVWLNGKQLGGIKGAFIRGSFDVSSALKIGGTNVLAVRVSPPLHPGIPHEQSMKAGAGENGGIMCLDGPTFVATEGWDWIPAIRDRDTGIWQPVVIHASSSVRIGDPQVVTKLPLPDTSQAIVEITVPLQSDASGSVRGTLVAAFENVRVEKQVTLQPGKNDVKLSPAEFSQLNVQSPRLWWPNGYGKPELYTLKLSFSEGGKESDAKNVRFGIREVTYEVSLLDNSGHLRRVDYSPTAAREKGEWIVEVRHEGIREIAPADPAPPYDAENWGDYWQSWTASLRPGAEKSAAVKPVEDTRTAPYINIKVNGVRIAARGGSWGMDDARKRVSRERLEPYFRLHRDANVNIIRNWVGQSTEEAFFDLADEYGLMVWNDFWASTQNYNVEPQDVPLFLDNARDVILRDRNHPSIVIWVGRNEGVPQPILNEGLDDIIRALDGTRYYSPTSNMVNLQISGPYRYVDPKLYFTTLNHGFSVETGTLSFPTLEMWRAWIAPADRWPIGDAWAYHDWHQGGNGDTAPYMAEMEKEFGAPTSLEDFDRKVQMMNYVQHRAIFEGMNAHLWAPNSGRMLWMTQPAWPSTNWQIFSSDYDTQASFYAVKKSSEPLHIQLDPTTYTVQVANSLPGKESGLTAKAIVYGLDNKVLAQREEKLDAVGGTTDAFALDLAPLLKENVVLARLELKNGAGQRVSDNFYWLGGDSSDLRKLNKLPAGRLSVTAAAKPDDADGAHLNVHLENIGSSAVLAVKFTLLQPDGKARVLPAYYSDNYVSLLPGEAREIKIDYPRGSAMEVPVLGVRAWNFEEQTLRISGTP